MTINQYGFPVDTSSLESRGRRGRDGVTRGGWLQVWVSMPRDVPSEIRVIPTKPETPWNTIVQSKVASLNI